MLFSLSRNVTYYIHCFFDEYLPPTIRDRKWFMWLPFKLLFGKKAKIFLSFKKKAPYLTNAEFCNIYKDAQSVFISRASDLTELSITELEKYIIGPRVLDIACGKGFLAGQLASKYDVTAADIVISARQKIKYSRVSWLAANIENLPFIDQQFDTVICTHTLEHVMNIKQAINELRRVSRQRLLIIVPKQRPYSYTFDLHLHFFPYPSALMMLMKDNHSGVCEVLKGDLFYRETTNGSWDGNLPLGDKNDELNQSQQHCA